MRKTIFMIFITVLTLLMASIATAEVIFIDDFDESDGGITSANVNNMGYHYAESGCQYIDNTLKCGEQYNWNVYDIQSQHYMIEADIKIDNLGADKVFQLGSSEYLDGGIRFHGGSDGTMKIGNGFSTLVTLPSVSFNTWYHLAFLVNNGTGKVSYRFNGIEYNNSGSGYPLPAGFKSIYYIRDLAGESIWVDNITITDLTCSTNWTCSGYEECVSPMVSSACNTVTDTSECGYEYTGDYTEFEADACVYCTPDWSCVGYETCVSPAVSVSCNNVSDENDCSEAYTGNYSEFTLDTCVYPVLGGGGGGSSFFSSRTATTPNEEAEEVVEESKIKFSPLSDDQKKIAAVAIVGIAAYFFMNPGSLKGKGSIRRRRR